jgi:predicted Holliday junction resolvase-like endonuclease
MSSKDIQTIIYHVDQKFEKIDQQFEEVKSEISTLHLNQKQMQKDILENKNSTLHLKNSILHLEEVIEKKLKMIRITWSPTIIFLTIASSVIISVIIN